MNQEDTLVSVVGKADACELLSRVFAFPDEELVQGMRDGSVVADARACLNDVGCDGDAIWDAYSESEITLSGLRIEYTRIYLTPSHLLIYPYESAYMHTKAQREGAPVLFRSPITLDVESQMRGAGVVPKSRLKEPCDSVFQELEFLSYLYGSLARAIQSNDAVSSEAWSVRIKRFLTDHALRWIPSFMEETIKLSSDSVYNSFARTALCFLACLDTDARYEGSNA